MNDCNRYTCEKCGCWYPLEERELGTKCFDCCDKEKTTKVSKKKEETTPNE